MRTRNGCYSVHILPGQCRIFSLHTPCVYACNYQERSTCMSLLSRLQQVLPDHGTAAPQAPGARGLKTRTRRSTLKWKASIYVGDLEACMQSRQGREREVGNDRTEPPGAYLPGDGGQGQPGLPMSGRDNIFLNRKCCMRRGSVGIPVKRLDRGFSEEGVLYSFAWMSFFMKLSLSDLTPGLSAMYGVSTSSVRGRL